MKFKVCIRILRVNITNKHKKLYTEMTHHGKLECTKSEYLGALYAT